MSELTRAPRLGVENPQLLVTAPRRREDNVPTIRRPGRIFVLTFAGELLRNAISQVDHPYLEFALVLLVRDRATVRRPVRARPITAHSGCVLGEQLNVRAVRIHNINLRRARLSGDERDLAAVGTVRGRRVVGTSADGDSLRRR